MRRLYEYVVDHAFTAAPLLCVAYYLIYFNYGIVLDDEGFVVWGASSILQGQWPVADFISYQPGLYFLLAGFFRLFGETLVVERIFLILHILVCVTCLVWCGRLLLPRLYSVIPAALFAFAPGPWYKIFFIFHVLLILVAALRFAARPDARRALWFGLAIGFAATSRDEVVPLAVVLFIAALGLDGLAHLWGERFSGNALLSTVRNAFLNLLAGGLGLALPVCVVLAVYSHAGKLAALIANGRIYNGVGAYQFGIDLLGRAATFKPASLLLAPSLEQWFYALGVAGSAGLLLANLPRFGLRDRAAALRARQKALVGGLALASMSYTYFYVWDSRMLSSFAVVYLATILALADLGGWLGRRGWARGAAWAVQAGALVILGFIGIFCRTAVYSGSISARLPASVRIDHPFLRGAWVYDFQAADIAGLMAAVARTPEATIVPMSEANTMAYLSGLRNPTYIRLFVGELAPPGAEDAVIADFEREKIDYFVARSGQFIPGGAAASDLARYAPRVKAYLLDHYDVKRLGERYVLLERRP